MTRQMNSENPRIDTKYWIMLVVALAGVLVPVWLWRSELASKSLTVSVLSTASLTPDFPGISDAVAVTVGGQTIGKPFVSTIEISSTGSRPVLAIDFEGPLQLKLRNQGAFIKAYVNSAQPASLQPVLNVSPSLVTLTPLLLNPNDVLHVALLTSGGQPQFEVEGRIAGVSNISILDAARERIGPIPPWIYLVASFVIAVATWGATERAWSSKRITSRWFLDAATSFIGMMLVGTFSIIFLYLAKFDKSILFIFLVILPQVALAVLINHRGMPREAAKIPSM